ncbi:LOW QUALITY PROTEIN: hypothetical protein V2J09_005950 [Rumex salicifolius]
MITHCYLSQHNRKPRDRDDVTEGEQSHPALDSAAGSVTTEIRGVSPASGASLSPLLLPSFIHPLLLKFKLLGMNSLQVASFRPLIDVKKISLINGVSSVPCITTAHVQNLSKTYLKLTIGRLKYQRCHPVCVFEDMGKSEYSNQEPLENSIRDSGKKLSLEEILRQQIERQEGSGGVPPSDGGGGGGRGRRGRGGDSGGSEEGTPAEQWDELLQVTLATMGLISLYLYILHGPEITRLGKDYLRFLLSGNKSVRLKRAMYVFGRFWRSLTQKKKVVAAEDSIALLQREILNTPTWYDSPSKYEHIVKAYMASKLSDHE